MDIAQPAGVDAVKLVVKIVQAAKTVRHNKETCQQLEKSVQMIGDLLKKLQNSETMQHPEFRNPLNGLEDILGDAYRLIISCQNRNYMYHFFMGGKLADQFRAVQKKIDYYLQVFPMISHIDNADRLDQILNIIRPPRSQAVEEVPRLFTSCSNSSATCCSPPDARIWTQGQGTHRIKWSTCSRGGEGQRGGGSRQEEVVEEEVAKAEKEVTGEEFVQEEEARGLGFGGDETHGSQGSLKIKFSQLVDATNNFSPGNKIGQGSFGCVYKGQLHHGLEVAVKRCFEVPSSPSELEFRDLQFTNEILFLTELQHINIVKLLGYCIQGEERILVYEYMSNGSFDTFIFGARTGKVYLDWSIRYRIAKGIAEGLLYLHKHCGLHIIHGDLKPSNILLDSDMNPKICDFGMARKYNPGVDEEYADRIVGSIGFIAPECRARSLFSDKSDVYGFGALLLEIISGIRCFSLASGESGDDYGFLNKRAWHLWRAGRLIKLLDSPLRRDESQTGEIMRCIQIALLCVEENPVNRPTMQEVVLMLSCQSVALPTPQRPAYLRAEMIHAYS